MEDKKFNHISVTPDDEDEFVIHAGATRAAEGESVQQAAPDQAAQPAQQPAQQAAPAAEPKGKPADAYHETTEADIDASSMSTMQKAIIAAALVAIVAFALYYFVMR